MSTDKDFNSDESGRAKSRGPTMLPAEVRERATQRVERCLESVKSTRPERVIKMLDGIPKRYFSLAVRVLSNDCTARMRIKFNCQQCVGWEEVQDRVGKCSVSGYAFWDIRPYRDRKGQVTT